MKTPPRDLKFLQGERVFLHEISSPLMLADGWLERWAAKNPDVAAQEGYRQVKAQLEKLKALLAERRDQLIALEKDHE